MPDSERADNLTDPRERNHALAILLETDWNDVLIIRIERTATGWRVHY